jgi:hypothetical protein
MDGVALFCLEQVQQRPYSYPIYTKYRGEREGGNMVPTVSLQPLPVIRFPTQPSFSIDCGGDVFNPLLVDLVVGCWHKVS